jgi:hypothetical protein
MELRYFVKIEGEEKEITREEYLKFWLPPGDDRTWQLYARRADA